MTVPTRKSTHTSTRLRLTAAVLMLAAATCAPAQQLAMRDVFGQMPDTLLPTMSKNNRLDMIDFIDSGMKAVVTDKLNGQCTMDTLTADYARISFGGSLRIEFKLLPSTVQLPDSSLSVVCMAKTFGSSEKESTVSFFTEKWKPLPLTLTPDGYAPRLVARPDTMSTERYDEICPDTSLLMVAATLSPTATTLTLTPTMPMQTKDERKDTAPLLRTLTLEWNGKAFATRP